MARIFDFSVLRLMPDPARGEVVNLGIVVFRDDGLEVRIGEVLTRARLLYPDLTPDSLRESIAILRRLDAVSLPLTQRHAALRTIGPFALGELGRFTAEDSTPQSYEINVARVMQVFTGAIRAASNKVRSVSRLTTTVREVFRAEKVLASIGEADAITKHKIVPEWPLPSRPSLRAGFAQQNGILRVCEVVELNMDDEGPAPPGLFESVVTLDTAQSVAMAKQAVFAYRATGPTARIDEALKIAATHATEMVDWDNSKQRDAFLHQWVKAAKSLDATHNQN